MSETWSSGAAYEPYIGRWSRLIAQPFLTWLGMPSKAQWLDVGCGTGALTASVLAFCDPARVEGVDPTRNYIAYARQHIRDPRVQFTVGEARLLPFQPNTFRSVVAGLVLNFVERPEEAIAEMKRVLQPGGVAAVYVWDYVGQMQMIRSFWDAAVALHPEAQSLDEGVLFPICQPDRLIELWTSARFDHITVQAMDIPTIFRDFDDYWTPFLSGQGPAPAYCMGLSEPQRLLLREAIRSQLPFAPDGSIHLNARVWAIKGSKGTSLLAT